MEIQNSDELSNNRNKERKECSAINGFIQGGSREQVSHIIAELLHRSFHIDHCADLAA